MARLKLSLPHERRKAALQTQKMKSRIAVAEHKERIARVNQELAAMSPPKKKPEQI